MDINCSPIYYGYFWSRMAPPKKNIPFTGRTSHECGMILVWDVLRSNDRDIEKGTYLKGQRLW